MSAHLVLSIPGLITGQADGFVAVVTLAAIVLGVIIAAWLPSSRR